MPALRKSVSVVTLQPAVFLQPVQTNRQTKAEPLQPAVVHQVERKLKIDFSEKPIVKLLPLFGHILTAFHCSVN